MKTGRQASKVPSRPFPQYNPDRAKTEFTAITLLTQGLPEHEVRAITGLSVRRVRELATMCAEEADNPMVPVNVCKRANTPQYGTVRETRRQAVMRRFLPRPLTRSRSWPPRAPEPVQTALDLDG
ncbi:hypothetical protein [Streptomyces sp. N35]|uniref:hypothetical protein n=1 Tax=Streptomyces sp. N35 TaxID=2795730 RepID=UPI0018F747AF|nr:hypothetical protein [Streptomyces sp. N35]